jgi:hypothetical protein
MMGCSGAAWIVTSGSGTTPRAKLPERKSAITTSQPARKLRAMFISRFFIE